MAARINRLHQDSIREKIRASQLINALEDHVLKTGKQKRDMSATQVTAALGLLRKCVPDLTSTEHSGELTHTHVQELSDSDLLNIAAGRSTRAVKATPSPQEPPELH